MKKYFKVFKDVYLFIFKIMTKLYTVFERDLQLF